MRALVNPPAAKGRGPLFWLAAVGALSLSCCCLSSLVLVFVGEEAQTVSRVSATSAFPTGDTPQLFPGTPGWLPSGRGSVFPDAGWSAGAPQGLWWYPQVQQRGLVAIVELYLPDGTYAVRPRPGGPFLFDLEGHRASGGTLGTFSRQGDTITRAYETYAYTDPFSKGEDDEGPWFNAGAARRRPIAPVDEAQLIGTWTSAGSSYDFRADGTMTIGSNDDVAVGSQQGTWRVEGYLLQLSPAGAPSWLSFVGSTGKGAYLVINGRLFSKN